MSLFDGSKACLLYVRLTPHASHNAVDAMEIDLLGQPTLKVRVTAPPEDNKANLALLILLAKHLKVPKSTLSIVKGHRTRNKVVGYQPFCK